MGAQPFSNDPDFWPTWTISEILGQTLDLMEHRGSHPIDMVLTGYFGLDQEMGGLAPGELTVIAGDHRTGKTSLALNITRHVATSDKRSVLYVSTRTPLVALTELLLSAMAEVNVERLHRGRLRQSEWRRIGSAVVMLSDVGIHFLDHPFPRWEQIAAVAWRLREQGNLALVVVDSVQSVRPWSEGGGSNRCDTVGGLRQLAAHLDVPVVVTARLRRSDDISAPKVSDLDGADAIGSNRFILLTSTLEKPSENALVIRVDIETPSGRMGPAYLLWDKEASRLRDVSSGGQGVPDYGKC